MAAANGFGMRPGIILLREGTDTSQGIPQLISNINACQAVADMVRTTLGPRGMDKLVSGPTVTISNDGATIMKLLEIAHPAAKTLVDISMSQDASVGDGTTSVVLLASELLTKLKPLVEEGLAPTRMIHSIHKTVNLTVQYIQQQLACDASDSNTMLLNCARTALNSKLISNHQDLFAPMVVTAVQALYEANALDQMDQLIAIHKVAGGDVRQSFLVQGGVAFVKTFSYAGFEQMTKRFENPKILLLNVELELKSEKENAEVRIEDPSMYQSIVDAEWQVIYDKLDACIACGANIVFSKLPIGDLATQYFADRGLFCAGRVPDADLKRIAQATNATIQTTTSGLTDSILGTCELFEERQVGDQRFNVMENCPAKLTSTIVLRGGTEQFIAESERSLEDALKVVQRSLQQTVGVGSHVAGGGAVEMALAQYLRSYALTIPGKEQLIVSAYAKALEVIPRQLCDNAGLDSTDVLSMLRKKHAAHAKQVMDDPKNNTTKCWYGVDIEDGGITDTYELGVWEPSDNKINSIQAAAEAACVILSIDETVISPKSQDAGAQATGMMGGAGGGGGGMNPMGNMMGNAMDIANSSGPRSGQMGPGVSYMKGRGGG